MQPTITCQTAALAGLLAAGSLLWIQAPSSLATSVGTTISGGAQRSWEARDVRIDEGVLGVWATLPVRNISTHPIRSARFYVEYFGSNGKFCFSSVFDTRKNTQGETGPVDPGEERELLSGSYGLGMATEPLTAHVYVVEQDPLNDHELPSPRTLRIPVTMSGGGPDSWSRLRLTATARSNMAAIQDLILAEVLVDTDGFATETKIIHAIGSEMNDWFATTVERIHFFPAGIAGAPTAQRTLILVRVVDMDRRKEFSPVGARTSPWLREWMARTEAQELPAVQQVVFTHSGSGDFFENLGVGSGWSENVYIWQGPARQGWKLDFAPQQPR
jgi:hypothetical protein